MKNPRKVVALLLMAVMAAGMLVVLGGNVQAAKKVELNKKTVTLVAGKKVTLKLKNAPKKQKITWSSNKQKIAVVSKKGVVIAKKTGKADIIANVNGKKYKCRVTVKSRTDVNDIIQVIRKPVTPDDSETTPTTDHPIEPEPPKEIILTNTEGKDPNDVAALKKIIQEQNSNEADIPVDLNTIYASTSEKSQATLPDTGYQWNENGRLTGISWNKCTMSGRLDLSELTALTELYCCKNRLESLDVSQNAVLTKLYCWDNKLSELDVNQNTALTELYCYENRLSSLDVNGAIALTKLYCHSNQLKSLNVSKTMALAELDCSSNELESLDVSQNAVLTKLYCWDNKLSELDVNQNTALTELYCYENRLSTLNVSGATELKELYCTNNQLSSLDVSQNSELTELVCCCNKLNSLKVSGATALRKLACYLNELERLDVSQNKMLRDLNCWGNKLSELDVSQNPLWSLSCDKDVHVTGWPK